MTSLYHRPDDNCCVVYHGDKFTEKNKDPICWDLAAGTPLYDFKTKAIKGVDCGKHTWVDFTSSDENYMMGIAGRQNFDLQSYNKSNTKKAEFTSITIGPYDS